MSDLLNALDAFADYAMTCKHTNKAFADLTNMRGHLHELIKQLEADRFSFRAEVDLYKGKLDEAEAERDAARAELTELREELGTQGGLIQTQEDRIEQLEGWTSLDEEVPPDDSCFVLTHKDYPKRFEAKYWRHPTAEYLADTKAIYTHWKPITPIDAELVKGE